MLCCRRRGHGRANRSAVDKGVVSPGLSGAYALSAYGSTRPALPSSTPLPRPSFPLALLSLPHRKTQDAGSAKRRPASPQDPGRRRRGFGARLVFFVSDYPRRGVSRAASRAPAGSFRFDLMPSRHEKGGRWSCGGCLFWLLMTPPRTGRRRRSPSRDKAPRWRTSCKGKSRCNACMSMSILSPSSARR